VSRTLLLSGMSSAAETQSSFDDFKEFNAAISYPLIVDAQFPRKKLARAFRVEGGGNITVKTGAGESRSLTGISNPYFLECKISEVTTASAATKIVLFV
jgi:hypothetical protein